MKKLSGENLEITDCPMCSSKESVSTKFVFGEFEVVRCQMCELWYLSPRMTEVEMIKFYSQSSYFAGGSEGGYSNYSVQEMGLRQTFRRFLNILVKRGLTGGDLLEVGCGYGYLLVEARSLFNRRIGTDFSTEAVKHARNNCDEVYIGGIERIPQEMSFDVIISVGVLEHVYQPIDFVEKLSCHLNENGVLILATPDFGSFWRLIFGKKWPSFKIPEHVTFWDKKTLSRLFSMTGFNEMQTIPYPHAFPISLVMEKLGFSVPDFIGEHTIWLPATTVAMAARKKG